jgi:hypothetical protein
LDEARAAVEKVTPPADESRPEPINALGAQPVNLDLGHNDVDPDLAALGLSQSSGTPLSSGPVQPVTPTDPPQASSDDGAKPDESKDEGKENSLTPPPVPPPMMPPGL